MTNYTCTVALAAAFCAVPVLADEPISIAKQIAKPTEATRVSYDHWSFIRSKQQSHVCVTSNIDSKILPRLSFQNEPQPRGAAQEAAITLSAGKWDTGQTYSVFLKLFMAQDPQKDAARQTQRYQFKFDETVLLTFPDGRAFGFENYDQRYSIAPSELTEPLLEHMQTYTNAQLLGTLIKAHDGLTGQDESFKVTLIFKGFTQA
jgi:hypothetical protein